MESTHNKHYFGTLVGVFIPSLLMMFGVILFLRMGWLVGNAGLYQSLAIITVSAMLVFLTTLSLTTTATNSSIGGGGLYYIISRSFGIEVGSAIGIPLYVRQCLSIAFCVVGFAESAIPLLMEFFPNKTFTLAEVGIPTLALLTILAYVSANWAMKIQLFILATIIAAFFSLFMGSGQGIELSATAANYIPSISFWGGFAMFFPAMTGIESSVSLSGNLKNPSRSLPIGTVGAVLVTYIMYMAIPLFLTSQASLDLLAIDNQIVTKIAKIPFLITLGIWGATLSSALGGLLGAPRTLKALADDGVLPRFLGKEFGKTQEPRIAILFTFFIALIGVYFGSVDVIAPVLTMVCLVCYGTLNLASALEDFMGNPSWRPTFQMHWSISFFAAIGCLIAMLMINPGAAIITLLVIAAVYGIMKQRNLSAHWDDIYQGLLTLLSRFAITRLTHVPSSSKSWRPHVLVFTDNPEELSQNLLIFSTALTKNRGFLVISSILSFKDHNLTKAKYLEEKVQQLLVENHIHALVEMRLAKSVSSGMRSMISNYGLGVVVPNTIVFGGFSGEEKITSYLDVIKTSADYGRNTIILNEDCTGRVGNQNNDENNGTIDIWWDDEVQRNSELMVIFAFLLHKNPLWKQKRIRIKSIVTSELERENRANFLKDFAKINRIQISSKVFVAADKEKEFSSLLSKFSAEASMIFIGLKSPSRFATSSEYLEYFQQIQDTCKYLPPVAMVISSDHIDLEAIFKSPD